MTRSPLAAVLIGSALATGAVAAPAPLEGRWLTASGNLEVEIAPCGPAWCGTVTKVLGNKSMARDGDMQPADPRPALGLTLLDGLQPDAEATPATWHGTLYNREDGKTYRCRVQLDGADGLSLRAYVGVPLFGRSQRWVRATAP